MSAVHVAFEISSLFQRTTPGLDLEQARAEVVARTQGQGAAFPDERIDDITVEYQRISAMLAESGVLYAASCFGRFDGDWSMGSLVIGLQPLSYRDPEIAVAGMAKILAAEHGPSAEVSAIALPCGQATLVIRQSPDLRLPAEFTESGEDIPIDVAQLQAFIPVPPDAVPGAQTLVTVVFSTPSTDHWADYCELLVPFLDSLSFLPDQEAGEDTDAATDCRTPVRQSLPSVSGGPEGAFG
ncbi:hypothetical protein AB0C96_16025 [Streptomyces sp. NPDC048506]|uniref:hypothetical protein n=1 Tax=Streptomyces sp. NPDC048506 TaxID=3155028 RepID=UPI00344084FC